MSRRTLILFGLAACIFVVVVVTLVAIAKPLQIAYHLNALDRLEEQINSSNDLFERQRSHCERLATLGYLFHKTYAFENIPETVGVHGSLWRLVLKEFPHRCRVSLTLDNVLEVWDLAENEPRWNAFVDKYNVADFADRFADLSTDDVEHVSETASE